MDAAVAVEKLGKSVGGTRALDGLDLEVEAGEVHGLLGPNGAGKTTTLRVLLGLLRADSGVVRLLGGDPWRAAPRLHRRLAYVPGEVALWPNLTGGEVIELPARGAAQADSRDCASLVAGSVATVDGDYAGVDATILKEAEAPRESRAHSWMLGCNELNGDAGGRAGVRVRDGTQAREGRSGWWRTRRCDDRTSRSATAPRSIA